MLQFWDAQSGPLVDADLDIGSNNARNLMRNFYIYP